MKFNTSKPRGARSVSARALSGLSIKDRFRTLVAGGAALAVLAGGAVVPTATANTLQQDQAISSPGAWGDNMSVSGRVFVDAGGQGTAANANYTQNDAHNVDKPLAGLKVYAQWVDERVKGYAVSPVYTATTNAEGNYTIVMPKWVDSNGVEHLFKANPYQYLRVWTEDPGDQYQLAFAEGNGNFETSTHRYASVWHVNLSNGGNVTDQNISYHEVPETDWLAKPEDQQVESTATKPGAGSISGKVFYDAQNGWGQGDVPYYKKNLGDVQVPGIKVVGSYLRDEVVTLLDEWKKNNKGWTYDQLKDEQKRVIAEWEGENPGQSAIAETVYTTTDENGDYTLQFNGTYGNQDYRAGGDSGGGNFSYGLLNDKELIGKVADAPDAGTWSRSQKGSKHINWDYMYVYPVLGENVDTNMDQFQQAVFREAAWNISYSTFSGTRELGFYAVNQDFALKLNQAGFDVLDYDTTKNPATAGAVVSAEAKGLIPNSEYTIKWMNPDGTETGTECTVVTDNLGNIPVKDECKFEVPDTAKAGDIYTAALNLPNGTTFMADSFAVTASAVNYEDKTVEKGKEVTFPIPTFDDLRTKDVDEAAAPPEGTVFGKAANTPEWVTVNADGSLTAIAPEKGEYDIPVLVKVPLVKDGEPVKDADGNQMFTTQTATAKLTVTDPAVPDKDADKYNPDYTDVDTPSDKDLTIPAPKDPNGPLPDGTTFAPEGTLPDGVKVDPKTGEITVPAGSLPKGDTTIPVVVTYPDKSTETIDVKVTVTDPAAPNKDTYNPAYPDTESPIDADLNIPAPVDPENPVLPEGTTFAPGDDAPKGIEVDPDTGAIKVPAGTLTEGNNTIPVEVTYPDKTTETIEAEVEGLPAGTAVVDIHDASVIEGQEITPIPVTATNVDNPTVTGLPDGLTYNETTGQIEGTPTKLTDWGKTEETRDVTVTLSGTDKDGKTVEDTATITILRDTDGDGIPDITDTDDDNDGATDAEENEAGTDPKDPDSKPSTPVENPNWEDTTTKPGESVDIPNEGGAVQDGTTTETTGPGEGKLNPDGSITVTPDEDAKPGDKITVIVKDKDGKEIDRVEVTVDDNTPDWNDGSANPGESAKLPNKGGAVEEGTTTEVEGPGEADIDEDGNLIVTPNPDAKPGSEIKVTVKDPNKKVIDEVTVTVKDPNAGKIGKCVGIAAAAGLPLLIFIPLGLGVQTNIPGMQGLSQQLAGLNKKVADANLQLQKQLGLLNGPLASQAARIDAQLRAIHPDASKFLGGLASVAVGLTALGLVYNSCMNDGKESSSSATVEGSSTKDKDSSAKNEGSSSKDKGSSK